MIRPVLIAACLVPAAAHAQRDCGSLPQVDANFCAKDNWQIADDELNRLWGIVKPAADARGTGEHLLQEQRSWLRARDAACEPELSGGGSAAPMFYWACMEERTLARNAELRALR